MAHIDFWPNNAMERTETSSFACTSFFSSSLGRRVELPRTAPDLSIIYNDVLLQFECGIFPQLGR